MEYKAELIWCASEIASGAIKAGFNGDHYELTDADLEFIRGEQCDSPMCLPFADESVQAGFERDVEQEVNWILID